jgi:hypothetical protein
MGIYYLIVYVLNDRRKLNKFFDFIVSLRRFQSEVQYGLKNRLAV